MVKKLKILKDEDYERGKIPMTKFPIRAETFFRLAISEGERFLDIGVGTGSIAVQAALLGAEVTGIDQSSEAVELTYKNAKKHGVSLHLICGKAPADLPDMLFDKIFIGGASCGNCSIRGKTLKTARRYCCELYFNFEFGNFFA